jgi:LPS-assembly lipoprotein
MKIKLIIIIGILCSLTACGFKLYSKESIPPQLHTVYLQSNEPYGSLETSLKSTLSTQGINFTDTAQQAPIILNISGTSFTHDDSNTVSSSQATVYNFTYDVTFNLLTTQGKAIIQPQTVEATRTLTLNPNEVLDSNPEVDTMKQEMERELIFKITNRLNSKNTKQALIAGHEVK